MVYRVYVEKKAALANEARALLEDLRAFLGIESLTGLRLFNRYDLEGISRELFDYTVKTVLSEPQLDIVTDTLPQSVPARSLPANSSTLQMMPTIPARLPYFSRTAGSAVF